MKFCVATSDSEKATAIIKDFPNCSAVAFSDIPWYKFSPKSATKEIATAHTCSCDEDGVAVYLEKLLFRMK